MPKRRVTLELSPAEARALQGALHTYGLLTREQGLGPDELPGFYHRLERVQRLLADGLNYLTTKPWGQQVSITHHGANGDCPQVQSGEWEYCRGHPLHPARSA